MESVHNFRGRLSSDKITLNGGQYKTITITDLVIPQGTIDGMKLLLSLVVRKVGGTNRRVGSFKWHFDWYLGDNNPSTKKEVRASIIFKVTDQLEEDDTEPWTKMEYGAKSSDETCFNGPGEPGCDLEYWWVKFRIQDEDSGLHLIDVTPEGKEGYQNPQNQVYYRYIT